MTQDERWLERYKEVMEENHRNPSRHRIEEYDMLNWLKNLGKMKAESLSKNRKNVVFLEV